MFLTLEDETGIFNAVVWPSLFEMQRHVLMTASMMGSPLIDPNVGS